MHCSNLATTPGIPLFRPSWKILLLFSCLIPIGQLPADEVIPRPRAHAHNDYYHKRPLLDALSHGFCNVEADIYLVDGKLLVAHSRFELKPEKTLEKLYLDPLLKRVRDNTVAGLGGDRVFPLGPPFTLLIDFKTNGVEIYKRLQEVLPHYREMLTRVESGQRLQGAVTIVISGDRPREQIAKSTIRYVGIDGRLGDLSSKEPAHLLPLISDRWTSHFRWRGDGPMPAEEKLKLKNIVEQAHARGRRVRFWATPENPALWQELYDANVDLINTDKLAELEKFLAGQNPAPKKP
mgnify:CR=1 FL=1